MGQKFSSNTMFVPLSVPRTSEAEAALPKSLRIGRHIQVTIQKTQRLLSRTRGPWDLWTYYTSTLFLVGKFSEQDILRSYTTSSLAQEMASQSMPASWYGKHKKALTPACPKTFTECPEFWTPVYILWPVKCMRYTFSCRPNSLSTFPREWRQDSPCPLVTLWLLGRNTATGS